MSENTETRTETIESASVDDVRPGDHLTRARVWETCGATVTDRREGIAHHRNDEGDWCTKEGMWLTNSEGKDTTLTIHRPVPDLPTKPGAVIIPADGHEYIEATKLGETFRAREATRSGAGGWYAAWRSGGQTSGLASSWEIIPGTWKVADQ